MNGIQINQGNVNQDYIAKYGAVAKQPGKLVQHCGRAVAVPSEPSTSGIRSASDLPPSYQETMKKDQEDRKAAVVAVKQLSNWVDSMQESANRREREKGCCERILDNGGAGDMMECCCLIACFIPLLLLKGC